MPRDLVRRWLKQSYVDFQNLKHVVPGILKRPTAVFWGVRDYEEGGYCYLGTPKEWYIVPDCLVPFPKEDKVFAVYLNPLCRLYDMQAEKLEAGSNFRPLGWRDRYEVLLWSKKDS